MTSANRAIQLIKRIAGEREKRSKIPRRGLPTFVNDTTASDVSAQPGSPGEFHSLGYLPSPNYPVPGGIATFVSARLVQDFPKTEDEMMASFGQPQPKLQGNTNLLAAEGLGSF